MKRILIVLIVMTMNIFAGQEPTIQPLWPDEVPMKTAVQTADDPMLSIYLPDSNKNTGAAVVIYPGGGYSGLATDHEGIQIAEWLNENGIAGIICTYRRGPGSQHPVPLTDAKRAIRTVRYNAEKWKIDPSRIGVIGFSAGGHLASTTGTHFDSGDENAHDPIEKISSRPDFLLLIYPVISLNSEYTHQGSKRNLLGKNPDFIKVEKYSNHQSITEQTPPTFLAHTNEDTGVPPENSVLFYLGLRKAGVPAEMHIFERGRHGLGLGPDDLPFHHWPLLCIEWLKTRGIIE